MMLLLLLLAAPGEDRMLTALEEEMKRSMAQLRLPPAKGPYYLSYTVHDGAAFRTSASFGAITSEDGGRFRRLTIDARVGTHALDNTNYADDSSYEDYGGTSLPIDDDLHALRRALWLATDRAYKRAIETREKKVAYLQSKEVKDRPDDFSKEPPTTALREMVALEVDRARWTAEVKRLSAIFREYPSVLASSISFSAEAKNRWFVSSEGTRVRIGSASTRSIAVAAAQAADGARFLDYAILSEADAEKQVRELAQRMTQLVKAPVVEKYRGPILFEGDAAAQFFAQALAPHVSAPREQLGPRGVRASQYPMRDELGRRVMPGFITVIDDPSAKEVGGVPILGGWEFDDDGVAAQRITLVEKGVLKTFCMSRAPTRDFKRSNGHSHRGWGAAGVLMVSSENRMPMAELRRSLIQLGKRDELPYVYVVRRMSPPSPYYLSSWAGAWGMRQQRRSSEVSLSPPLLLYRVSVRDGSETLVRGAVFGNHSLRILRDIEATGDDVRAHPVMFAGDHRSLVAPSLLIEEVEIETTAEENEKPPYLPHPFFDMMKK